MKQITQSDGQSVDSDIAVEALLDLWEENQKPYKASKIAKELGNVHHLYVVMALKESGRAKKIINEWGEKGWVPYENPIMCSNAHSY